VPSSGSPEQGAARAASPRRTFAMTIVAQDPSVANAQGMLRATVPVPADRLEPGPRSHRFQVIDYDATARILLPPARLTAGGWQTGDWGWAEPDPFRDRSDAALLSDPAFHAQNMYAIAARTLAVFESAIGRRLNWGFLGHELYLVPHAMAEANAYYADDVRAVLFGYMPARPRRETRAGSRALRIARSGRLDPDAIYTCLSHDVIAHETTHAVLDGLRPRFLMPGLPDQPAFHEGLADIVALLSVFSMSEVVQSLLGQADLEGRIAERTVTDQELKRNALFTLAEQVGSALKDERGSALRDSIRLRPSTRWASDPQYREPHSRGEILVWIILESLAGIWRQRLADITVGGSVSLARAAEEGATAAQHLLGMCVRVIDYLPPVEFEFPDFLAALLVSDAEIVPDDKHGYRDTVRGAFARSGIQGADDHIADLSLSALTPVYRNLSYTALRSDTDEVFRFIWETSSSSRSTRVSTSTSSTSAPRSPAQRLVPGGHGGLRQLRGAARPGRRGPGRAGARHRPAHGGPAPSGGQGALHEPRVLAALPGPHGRRRLRPRRRNADRGGRAPGRPGALAGGAAAGSATALSAAHRHRP
jgi:hypothetical protein